MENNLSQKAIKLASAVYRVTGLFLDGGVLKNQIREKTGEIVFQVSVFSAYGRSPEGRQNSDRSQKKCYAIKADIEGLKALFNIAKEQNWVKPVNFEILSREYTNLEKELEDSIIKKPKTIPALENNEPSQQLKYNSENRQSQILGYLKNNGRIQIAQVCQLFPQVSRRTLIRDLDVLSKSGLIQRNGGGRGICYKFSESNIQTV